MKIQELVMEKSTFIRQKYGILEYFRCKGIVLTVFTLVLITVLSSGCISSNGEEKPCLTCSPQTPAAAADLHMKGFNAYINGNFANALEFYDQSIAADPKYTRAWMDKGNVLIRLNRTEEAISAYDSALALENNLPLVWNSRGEALMTIGKYTEARDSFDKALKIAPEYAKAKENRELALAKLK